MEDLGQRLPYRVVRVLGEGSHGVVLEVEHKRLGKPFVVKLIQQKFSENRDVVQRFVSEAQRVARLDHEAFVPIVDLGETDDGRAYFVMEYVAGVTLQQALRDKGAFALGEAVRLGADLLDGLAVAHGAHIVHRDIKPANLFLTARGRLKILDFGISKSMIDSGTGVQTAHGIAIGTPRYMSPEQAYGHPVSPATDVYAVGLVVHELLTGQPVFDGADSKAILYAQIHTPAPSIAERAGRAFPASVEAVIARALRKDPRERFQSAAEMAAALRATLDDAPSAPSPSPDATQDERVRPTVRISEPHAPSSTSHDTRPVSAEALVVGAASTSQAVVVGPPPTPAEAVDATARTEALPAMLPAPFVPPGGTAPSSMPAPSVPEAPRPSAAPAPARVAPVAPVQASPAPREDVTLPSRPRSPLLAVATFVGALGLALAAIFGVVYALRGPRASEAPAAGSTTTSTQVASSVPAAQASSASATPSASAPLPSASATPPPASASADPTSAVATVSAKKPVVTAPSASASASAKKPTHYAAAVEAMNAGDLEVADGEARLAVAEGGGVPAQLLLAQILERRGKKAAARDVYAKILETNPTMAAAVAGLKRCGG